MYVLQLASEATREEPRVDAARFAKAEKHELRGRGLEREVFRAGDGVAASDGGDVALRNTLVRPTTPPSGGMRIRVRAGAESEVVDTAPVALVVARVPPRTCEVRDLVL